MDSAEAICHQAAKTKLKQLPSRQMESILILILKRHFKFGMAPMTGRMATGSSRFAHSWLVTLFLGFKSTAITH
jgi:hypothetical protein